MIQTALTVFMSQYSLNSSIGIYITDCMLINSCLSVYSGHCIKIRFISFRIPNVLYISIHSNLIIFGQQIAVHDDIMPVIEEIASNTGKLASEWIYFLQQTLGISNHFHSIFTIEIRSHLVRVFLCKYGSANSNFTAGIILPEESDCFFHCGNRCCHQSR